MYIANLTQQIQEFTYRLPEHKRPIRITVPIGAQLVLPGDLTTPEIEAIVETQAPYGFTPVSEINKTKAFVGVCWQLDKRIDLNTLRYGIQHNFKVLDARGHDIRKEAAVAITEQLQATGPAASALEVVMKEVQAKDSPIAPTLHEVVRVANEEPGAGPSSTAAQAGRARGSRPRRAA